MKYALSPRFFALILTLLWPFATTAQQSPTTLQQQRQVVLPPRPSWENVPSDEAATQPVTEADKALLQARSDAFNTKIGHPPRLEDVHQTVPAGGHPAGVGGSTDHGYVPPLPVNSTAVVVAKVLSAQSHLSTDHTTIYTELKLQIQKLIKDSTGSLAENGSLDVLETGGTVRLNGQVLHYPLTSDSGLLDIGNRYLLFLYSKPSLLHAFGVSKAWSLNLGHPQPASAYRANDLDNVARYTAMNESEFISYVQHAIESNTNH